MTPLVRVLDRPVAASLFRRLVRQVRALGGERLRQTYQTTFWFDLQQPTAVTEEVILTLWPRLPRLRVSGVEWWLSRMWTHDVQVDFHRDRDEALAERTGQQRHPLLSSVLFLNRVQGGALAVTEQPPVAGNPALAPLPLDADLVAPRPNRFVWFNGRLTHGVLDASNQLPTRRRATQGELRLALVMNWWNRPPTEVPRLRTSPHYRSLSSPPIKVSPRSGRPASRRLGTAR